MKFEVAIDGAARAVDIERRPDGSLRIRLDGNDLEADAVETAAGTYSILLGGQAFEARVIPGREGLVVRCAARDFHVEVRDPRAWRRGRGGALGAEGRQQVTAPMPGKIVRVLVAAGAGVEMGQGLVVVEAMKMQNEICAPKNGVVERVPVREGQAVAAGEILVVIA
jgi:biotin carboxyl carrier protein